MPTLVNNQETLADLVKQLGGISLERIRLHPAPGHATERDLLRLLSREDGLFELVDGVLVEKAVGWLKAFLAARLIQFLANFADQHELGIVLGADALVRLRPRRVRIPDVAFYSWRHFPNREIPRDAISDLPPDLAIEVLSESNTPEEIARKLREYFLGGVRLAWIVDPSRCTVEVFTSPDQSVVVTEEQALDGGEVLPGFTLPLRDLFARVKRPAAKRKPANGKKRRKPSS